MSLIDTLRDKAIEEADSLSEDQLKEQFDKLIRDAREALPQGERYSHVRSVGGSGLDAFARNRDKVAQLGKWGAVTLAADLASGDEEAALQLFLRDEAGWDAIFAAVDDAQAKDAQAKRDREAAKAAVLGILKDVGTATARAALPFLLKVVGL